MRNESHDLSSTKHACYGGLAELPLDLHDFVEATVGPFASERTVKGGVSPGWTLKIQPTSGLPPIFLKAVMRDAPMEAIVRLRQEAAVGQWVTTHANAPRLLSYNETAKHVALLFQWVPGRHPDFTQPDDRRSVLDAVLERAHEPCAPPEHAHPKALAESWTGWMLIWNKILEDADRFLPPDIDRHWAARTLNAFPLDVLANETLCHWDLSSSNILLNGPPRGVVLLDWGMARLGPRWADSFRLTWGWAQDRAFLGDLLRIKRELDVRDGVLGGMLLAVAGVKAWNAQRVSRAGLCWDPARERAFVRDLFRGIVAVKGKV